MNTTVHYINGTPMTEKDFAARMPCSMCQGGTWFTARDYVKNGEHDEDYKDLICNACITKYRKPMTAVKYYKTDTLDDESALINHLVCEIIGTRKTMDKSELEALRKAHDEFSTTGKCKKHIWKDASPVKTKEGTFVFKGCLVCLLGQVKHDGKVYQDQLPKLVSWIVHKGLSIEKAQKQKEDELIEANIKADISFEGLFDDDESLNIQFV